MTSLAYSIGKADRKDTSVSPMRKVVPGPGTYENNNRTLSNSPKWGFGSGKRGELTYKSASNLGPGDYKIPSKAIEGQRYTIAGPNHKLAKFGTCSPGPGAYQPKSLKDVSLSYSLAQKFESGIINKTLMEYPGPGGYNPQPVYKQEGSTKFGLGKRQGLLDENRARMVPSASAYNPNIQTI